MTIVISPESNLVKLDKNGTTSSRENHPGMMIPVEKYTVVQKEATDSTTVDVFYPKKHQKIQQHHSVDHSISKLLLVESVESSYLLVTSPCWWPKASQLSSLEVRSMDVRWMPTAWCKAFCCERHSGHSGTAGWRSDQLCHEMGRTLIFFTFCIRNFMGYSMIYLRHCQHMFIVYDSVVKRDIHGDMMGYKW